MKAVVYTSNLDIHNLCLSRMYWGCPFEKEVHRPDDYRPSDIAVIFGTRKEAVPFSWQRGEILRQQREKGLTTVVVDAGYVKRGDTENSYFMVGLDGLNNRAEFRNAGMPSDRWEKLGVELEPWREDGNHILVAGQVPWDASCEHVPNQKWCQDAIYELQRFTDRPIRYRPHPKAVDHSPPVRGATYSTGPLRDDFKDCWAVVTFNSNTSVDAVIRGIPCLTFDEGAMTWDVTDHDFPDIEAPTIHDYREQWAWNLAYTQFKPGEMEAGLPWSHLFG